MFSFLKDLLLGALINAFNDIIDFCYEYFEIPLFPNYLIGM